MTLASTSRVALLLMGLVLVAPIAACEAVIPAHLASLKSDPLAMLELPDADVAETYEDDAHSAEVSAA